MEFTSASAERHRTLAGAKGTIAVALVTVSDTRTSGTDDNGKYLRREVESCGHQVVDYRLIRDEPAVVLSTLEELAGGAASVQIWNGGTGISPRDATVDVIGRVLEKTLCGFGEIFRMLSYGEIGSAAIHSRAVAGVYHGRIILSVPGSPAAVRLAWEKLIRPELPHLAWEVNR